MSESPEELTWTCHPVRSRPLLGVGVAALVLLFCIGAHLSFGDTVLTAVSAAVLTASVAPFYLPTRYRITDDNISIRSTFGRKEKDFSLFRRLVVDRHGALLSPFDRPSRLDRFHGVNLRFNSADRERVLDYLGQRLGEHEREG